jgi:hypothetical protein
MKNYYDFEFVLDYICDFCDTREGEHMVQVDEEQHLLCDSCYQDVLNTDEQGENDAK